MFFFQKGKRCGKLDRKNHQKEKKIGLSQLSKGSEHYKYYAFEKEAFKKLRGDSATLARDQILKITMIDGIESNPLEDQEKNFSYEHLQKISRGSRIFFFFVFFITGES